MAASLGISVQAFDKWEVEPIARIGREKFFDCRTVLDSKLAEQAEKHRQQQPSAIEGEEIDPLLSYRKEQEDYRLTRARREAQELKNDRDAGRVVPTDFAVFALSRTAVEIASILDTVPLTMRRKHPELEARQLDSLLREITRARNAAASISEQMPEIVKEYSATVEVSG
ncbi:DNA-packaging protein [Halomonas alkaliantarctica]|nr:DNA-packaging protein [Halomonas alkaliantarctica]